MLPRSPANPFSVTFILRKRKNVDRCDLFCDESIAGLAGKEERLTAVFAIVGDSGEGVCGSAVVELREGLVKDKRGLVSLAGGLKKSESHREISHVTAALAERVDGTCFTVGKYRESHIVVKE